MKDQISDHYLIWDSDMMMTERFHMYNRDGRTRQHSGGFFVPSYASAHHTLTGEPLIYGPQWSSFVVHHAIVYREYMEEMLDVMESDETNKYLQDRLPKYLKIEPGTRWAWNILSSIPSEVLNIGFSEYASYASWVIKHHPGSIDIQSRQTWSRYAPLQVFPSPFRNSCCPTEEDVKYIKEKTTLEFVGFEFGHIFYCNDNK